MEGLFLQVTLNSSSFTLQYRCEITRETKKKRRLQQCRCGEKEAALNHFKASVTNIYVWPHRLRLLHSCCMYKNGCRAGCGFWLISRFSTPTAVILRKSRIQSLITFIPSRAGHALPLRDVGKRLARRRCGAKGSRADRANTSSVSYKHTANAHWNTARILSSTPDSHSRSMLP